MAGDEADTAPPALPAPPEPIDIRQLLADAGRYIPVIWLACCYVAWAMFMTLPAVSGAMGADAHAFVDNLSFALIGLVLIGAMQLAGYRRVLFYVSAVVFLLLIFWF